MDGVGVDGRLTGVSFLLFHYALGLDSGREEEADLDWKFSRAASQCWTFDVSKKKKKLKLRATRRLLDVPLEIAFSRAEPSYRWFNLHPP